MKKIKFIFFVLLILMLNYTYVSAETGVLQKGDILYFNGSSVSTTQTSEADPYPNFPYKYSDKGSLVCVSGIQIHAPYGSSCKVSTMTQDSIGTAYLINEYTNTKGGIANLANSLDKYYWSELSVLYYLDKYIPEDNAKFMQGIYNFKININNKTFSQTQAEAKVYENKYSNSKYSKDIELSLSSKEISFSEGSDGNYYSNKIYITDKNGNSDSLVPFVNNSNFELIKNSDNNGNYFQLKISKNKLVSQMQNVKLTVKGSYEYYKSIFYDCDGEYQDLISTTTTRIYKTNSVDASGKIGLAKLTIKKQDQNNQLLAGAVIKVENKSKTYSKTFTTTNDPIIIEGLPFDEYTISEVKSPDGYALLSEKYNVTFSESKLQDTVILKNSLTRVEIKKLDKTTNEFLSGAVLQIQDINGNVVKDNLEKAYEWTTDDKSYVVEGLAVGTYYLVEKSAPDSYVLNKQKIKFEITTEAKTIEVVMYNTLNTVKISKWAIASNQGLSGATLEIQDEEGNIVNFCKDEKGTENSECKWVSTNKPYEIVGMPNGTYYLVETVAPEGYVLNKEKVKFIVDGSLSVVNVEMKNELEVKVPDTLSARSTLLIAIAMFNIALGIGIVTYVKKDKSNVN